MYKGLKFWDIRRIFVGDSQPHVDQSEPLINGIRYLKPENKKIEPLIKIQRPLAATQNILV